MNNISFDLSGKIDQQTTDALALVKDAADSLEIPFFIIGATARDMILTHCYGIQTIRMTKDIDLGVEIEDWARFDRLKEFLLSTGRFVAGPQAYRLIYGSLPLDIVPFGKISDQKGQIIWPPEHDIFMSLVGFKEAYEYSILVRLSSDPDLDIRLPTLPGLAIMKLISWKDKYPERKTDADDLLFIMQKYEAAGNTDRLYETEQDLLEEEGFDVTNASIRMLGRDMAIMADPGTLTIVRTILKEETKEDSRYRLAADMTSGNVYPGADFEYVLSQLGKLRKGFAEASEGRQY